MTMSLFCWATCKCQRRNKWYQDRCQSPVHQSSFPLPLRSWWQERPGQQLSTWSCRQEDPKRKIWDRIFVVGLRMAVRCVSVWDMDWWNFIGHIYIYDFQSQPFKSCGPLPTTMLCSFAHLHNELHAGTTVVLLPKGSFLLWVVAKPKLLRRNGRVSWSGAPKLAQILVGKCGQIWDNANRYTKYKICVKICHSMLHMSYVWNNPLNFQTKINIYQHVSFLIFDVRIQQIKPWGTATRSCHWWCPCSPAWRTSATVWKSGRTGVILQLGHDKRNGKHVELWKRVQRHETSFLISSK